MRALHWFLIPIATLAACMSVPESDPSIPHLSRATATEGVARGWSTEARYVKTIGGFDGPESVKYDAEQDVYFVTNQTGPGSAKDGNGYIARVSAADADVSSVFAQGGKNGVVLDSPKGLAIHGDTLWTTDIDKLRGFDRHTGAPIATIDFAPVGAVQLNDIDVGADGSIHVTDTGILMTRKGVIHTGPDRIFIVGPGRAISLMAQGPELHWPNGIKWDDARKRWVVVSFDPFGGEVASYPANGAQRKVLLHSDRGNFDGVEVLGDGTILYASWMDSTIYALDARGARRLIQDVPDPADIGLDTTRGYVLVPLTSLSRVELWALKR